MSIFVLKPYGKALSLWQLSLYFDRCSAIVDVPHSVTCVLLGCGNSSLDVSVSHMNHHSLVATQLQVLHPLVRLHFLLEERFNEYLNESKHSNVFMAQSSVVN